MKGHPVLISALTTLTLVLPAISPASDDYPACNDILVPYTEPEPDHYSGFCSTTPGRQKNHHVIPFVFKNFPGNTTYADKRYYKLSAANRVRQGIRRLVRKTEKFNYQSFDREKMVYQGVVPGSTTANFYLPDTGQRSPFEIRIDPGTIARGYADLYAQEDSTLQRGDKVTFQFNAVYQNNDFVLALINKPKSKITSFLYDVPIQKYAHGENYYNPSRIRIQIYGNEGRTSNGKTRYGYVKAIADYRNENARKSRDPYKKAILRSPEENISSFHWDKFFESIGVGIICSYVGKGEKKAGSCKLQRKLARQTFLSGNSKGKGQVINFPDLLLYKNKGHSKPVIDNVMHELLLCIPEAYQAQYGKALNNLHWHGPLFHIEKNDVTFSPKNHSDCMQIDKETPQQRFYNNLPKSGSVTFGVNDSRMTGYFHKYKEKQQQDKIGYIDKYNWNTNPKTADRTSYYIRSNHLKSGAVQTIIYVLPANPAMQLDFKYVSNVINPHKPPRKARINTYHTSPEHTQGKPLIYHTLADGMYMTRQDKAEYYFGILVYDHITRETKSLEAGIEPLSCAAGSTGMAAGKFYYLCMTALSAKAGQNATTDKSTFVYKGIADSTKTFRKQSSDLPSVCPSPDEIVYNNKLQMGEIVSRGFKYRGSTNGQPFDIKPPTPYSPQINPDKVKFKGAKYVNSRPDTPPGKLQRIYNMPLIQCSYYTPGGWINIKTNQHQLVADNPGTRGAWKKTAAEAPDKKCESGTDPNFTVSDCPFATRYLTSTIQ